MTDIAPNTPVIIGVGFCQQKNDDPLACDEPSQLMINAVSDAAVDAAGEEKSAQLLAELDSISVEQGMWQYKNPGKFIIDALGCHKAKSILADLGVLQLTPYFDLCKAIYDGEQDLGVVTGGEAKYRELRAKITGQEVSNTEQGDDVPDPDVYHPTPDPFASDVEVDAGIFMPVELFAVIESALRAEQGLTQDEHRDKLAALYSSFSEIASKNPHAWNQQVVPAEEIRNPVGKNALLAWPYTKKHNAQWNVNQSVAIMICSYKKAKQLGLDESGWIYPLASVQSRHVVCLGQQKSLTSHPGTVVAGERAYQLCGISPEDVSAADLYSCFPAAVQSFAKDLKLDGVCPWSVTGSMAFAGGPYNHGALDGVARMVEVLRSGQGINAGDRRIGLTSNLSGIFGKQAVTLLSNQPNANGYCFEDVTEQVAKIDTPLPTNGQYSGPAKIVGYTIAFNKEGPSHAFAYCENTGGERTVAKSFDPDLLADMMANEYVGREVNVKEDKTFTA